MGNARVQEDLLERLFITPGDLARYPAPKQVEAPPHQLAVLGETKAGRVLHATSATVKHWADMRRAAQQDGIHLEVLSAFRSIDYQRQLIARKLDRGDPPNQILQVVALPGYSEHHTGRALDIVTTDYPELTEDFELSDGFAWLSHSAHQFGFSLSYPRDNPWGFIYEPWHWCFNPA
ncbi:M15 family metallopeptidase [Pseudomonadales bacterium]|jgi:D-alanyl-D-alanine carboxypeptidase|nr:M15 family metallopeptidase [Gammaproteobacteria bacterium]MDA9043593.1 M15 family metallopeptidase [Pseudomonadales bacterium]MDC1313758.1 M15 family metallopeptidase [Pseudomonadales bacterium]